MSHGYWVTAKVLSYFLKERWDVVLIFDVVPCRESVVLCLQRVERGSYEVSKPYPRNVVVGVICPIGIPPIASFPIQGKGGYLYLNLWVINYVSRE